MIKLYYYKYVHIEAWREKTGTSGHMTVLGFLVCAHGCKISNCISNGHLNKHPKCGKRLEPNLADVRVSPCITLSNLPNIQLTKTGT